MTQKVIEVVGTSKESFAKAAEEAVREAAKTVRGIKWAHVDSLDMALDGKKVLQYRATTKIYFDVEHQPTSLVVGKTFQCRQIAND